MNRWHYEFSEDGGYDACSAAFRIIDDKGWCPFVIDVAAFLPSVGHDTDEGYARRHAPESAAEELAVFLVNALNTFGK